ncbi:N/A [soil metagenome]
MRPVRADSPHDADTCGARLPAGKWSDNESAMSVEPELIVDHPCRLGESPIWHATENRLYWIDILTGRLFCFDPETSHFREILKTASIGALAIHSTGALLVFMSDGAVASFNNGALQALPMSVPEQSGFRFNDCVVDPVGRVYSGSIIHKPGTRSAGARALRKLHRLLRLPRKTGRVYRFDIDGRVTCVTRGIGRPNGMGISPDRSRFYMTDSMARNIYSYDFNEQSGTIANRRLFVHLPASAGATPDGLAVDRCGFVWSAHMHGGCIVRYRPDGIEDRRIRLPTPRVTSLTFGGAAYRDLYVTTAGGDRRAVYGRTAGALFRLRPGIDGLPEYPARIPIRPTGS